MNTGRIALFLSLAISNHVLAKEDLGRIIVDVLPLGPVEMSVLGAIADPRVDEIAARLYAHMADQGDWMLEYWQQHGDFEPGEALPYHENFGVTEEEYRIFVAGRQHASKATTVRLIELVFSKEGTGYKIVAPAEEEFGVVYIDTQNATVLTDYGLITQCHSGFPFPEAVASEFVSWYGMTCRYGNDNPLRRSGKSVFFSIGKNRDGKELQIFFSVNVVETGALILNINLTLTSGDVS